MNPLVVVGDTLLDLDVDGESGRVTPDSGVPVVDVDARWERPGGAGLAALLAARDHPDVVLLTALGDDADGMRLGRLLSRHCRVEPLPLDGETVCKSRVRAADRELLRIDTGSGRAAPSPLTRGALTALRTAGALLVADYGRGLAAHPQVRAEIARRTGSVPVVWDPHPRGPVPVRGPCVVTPNLAEACGALGIAESGTPGLVARELQRHWGCAAVAVTTGRAGATVFAEGTDAPTGHPVPVAAVSGEVAGDRCCGAGDRFAAATTARLSAGASLGEAIGAAVDAAARFVYAGGARTVSTVARRPATTSAGEHHRAAADLVRSVHDHGGRVVATGGCFDLLHPGHLSLLAQARALGDALVVCVNSDESTRRLKGPDRPIVGERDRVRMLLELGSVDAVVVFGEDEPSGILSRLRPDVWVKGGDYTPAGLPECAAVERGGGRVVILPRIPGFSTTSLVEAARRAG